MGRSGRQALQLTERKLLLVVVDALIVTLGLLSALSLWAEWDPSRFPEAPWASEPHWLLLSFLWLGAATVAGCYDLRIAAESSTVLRALVLTAAMVMLIYGVAYFFAPRQSLPRSVILVHLGISLCLLLMWRTVYAMVFRRPAFLRRALVVGAGESAVALVSLVDQEARSLYSLVGVVDDDPTKQGTDLMGLPVLGSASQVADIARQQRVAEVVVAISDTIGPDLLKGLLRVQEDGVQVTPMPLLYEYLTGRVPVAHVGSNWYVTLPLHHPQTQLGYSFVKRAFDLAVAAGGLLLFGPLLPALALAIRLDSPGPVLFRQERVGRNGRPYDLLKLRTMIVDAEPDGRAVWASSRDPRITRVGRLLRTSMLDEMPQLWNVLKGEMSIVGPRPERAELVDQLDKRIPYYRLRHAVNPGMAGWALLHSGYAGSSEEALTKLQYDLYYIKHQSLWLDLQIILRTVGRGLTFRRSEKKVEESGALR